MAVFGGRTYLNDALGTALNKFDLLVKELDGIAARALTKIAANNETITAISAENANHKAVAERAAKVAGNVRVNILGET